MQESGGHSLAFCRNAANRYLLFNLERTLFAVFLMSDINSSSSSFVSRGRKEKTKLVALEILDDPNLVKSLNDLIVQIMQAHAASIPSQKVDMGPFKNLTLLPRQPLHPTSNPAPIRLLILGSPEPGHRSLLPSIRN